MLKDLSFGIFMLIDVWNLTGRLTLFEWGERGRAVSHNYTLQWLNALKDYNKIWTLDDTEPCVGKWLLDAYVVTFLMSKHGNMS